MDLTALRANAKALYGLPQDTTEDALFTNDVLDMLLNDAHRRAAAFAKLYGREITLDLPARGDNGYSTVPLECNIIELVPGTVRAQLSGAWCPLHERDEGELIEEYGAPEEIPAEDSAFYFLRAGEALDAQLVMECYPGASAEVADGLKFRAYLYPSLMTLDTHTPAFPPAEHPRLLSVTCWRMALLDQARGRRDAPVESWYAFARQDLQDLADQVAQSRRAEGRRIRYFDPLGY